MHVFSVSCGITRVLGLLKVAKGDRWAYFREILQSPCRWAALLAFGWAISLANDSYGAVNWPAVALLISYIGRRLVAVIFGLMAVLPLCAIFIPLLWVRIICTTLPLSWWIFILLYGIRFSGFFTPAIWTAVVCILSLIQHEVRRAHAWDQRHRG